MKKYVVLGLAENGEEYEFEVIARDEDHAEELAVEEDTAEHFIVTGVYRVFEE